MRHYLVRHVMTVDPVTVTPATPLKDVAEILVRGRIGVVPVLTPQGRVAEGQEPTALIAGTKVGRRRGSFRAGPSRR